MDYVIVTDTSANLPSAFARENSIGVIPFSIFVNEAEYTCLDSDGFDAVKYYTWMSESRKIATSQITPYCYISFFKPILAAGRDILFIGMSSGVSGSFASAKMATEQLLAEYPDRAVRLVDSLGASLGEGLLVLKAAEWKKQGRSMDEIADDLLKMRREIYQVFTVDNLNYLRRGGRLSNSTAIVGNILNIKPVLKGDPSGRIVSVDKIRGRSRTIRALAERYRELVVAPETQTVGISHANCYEDAKLLTELISAEKPPREILVVDHEPATGSYLGPGALALYFQGAPDVRER